MQKLDVQREARKMIVEKTFISDGDCVVSRKAFEQTVEQNERYRALGSIDALTRLQRDDSDNRLKPEDFGVSVFFNEQAAADKRTEAQK